MSKPENLHVDLSVEFEEPAEPEAPWFVAAYDGDCSGCGQEFQEGDEIRADGFGGYEARCCDEE